MKWLRWKTQRNFYFVLTSFFMLKPCFEIASNFKYTMQYRNATGNVPKQIFSTWSSTLLIMSLKYKSCYNQHYFLEGKGLFILQDIISHSSARFNLSQSSFYVKSWVCKMCLRLLTLLESVPETRFLAFKLWLV